MSYPNSQGNPAAATPVWIAPMPPAGMVDKGYVQITDLTSAVGLGVVPAGARIAVLTPENGNVRWRSDGVDPTATVGNIIWGTSTVPISSGAFAAIKFINMTGSTSILNVQYYG